MNSRQTQILLATLPFVVSLGWTDAALRKGLRATKTDRTELSKFFPNGLRDLVASFETMIEDEMDAAINAKRKFTTMRVREKIAFCIRARLEAASPYRPQIQRLIIWSLMPRHVGERARQLWQTADRIWQTAGDTSTDYNYYTKRILLIAVMKSVTAFWLSDRSDDFEDTWGFLDRRIEDVMAIGKGMSVVKTLGLSDIVSSVKSRFSA